MKGIKLIAVIAAAVVLLLCAGILMCFNRPEEQPRMPETDVIAQTEGTEPVPEETEADHKVTESAETTSPTETKKPDQSKEGWKDDKPSKPSKPEKTDPDVELSVTPVPPGMTESTEPPAATEPPAPSVPPQQEEPEHITYEKYMGMSAQEQSSYRDSFDSVSDFFAWYNKAKEEYDAKNSGVDLGNGSVDLEDVMNGSAEK